MKTESCSDDLHLLEADGVLSFNPRFLDPSLPSGLWFCDCPEAVQAVEINAVCLSSAATWEDLGRCPGFFRPFPYIVIVCPDLNEREVMTHELRRRIADKIFYIAEDKAFRGCASVAELRSVHGPSAVESILLETRELPTYGLLDLADVRPPAASAIQTVRSGIPVLDKKIGGFNMGELSVWTGRRGEGKSTLLGELLLEGVDQDYRVCAYSGELPAWKFKYWISLQAAGPQNIQMQTDKRCGKTLPAVLPKTQQMIDEWLRRRFFLYDIGTSATHSAKEILRIFNYAHKCYGCNLFLVDNIMTARFQTGREADYYRAQSNFVAELVSFSRRANVHVHLVAHPRKVQNGKRHLENDDVGGIGDITNLADNVFSLERGIRKGGKGEDPVEQVTGLAILKNRMWGEVTRKDEAIQLDFDKKSKRFFRRDVPVDRRLGWDFQQQVELTELSGEDPDTPF